MFDMRYHIASLVAVFLALAVGIVLGTAIVNRGVLVRQQTALVSSLRQEFGVLRDRNRSLQDQANKDEQFFQAILPMVLDKRLAGHKVAVISTDSNDTVGVRQTVQALRQAGAAVDVVTITSPDVGTSDKATASKLSKIFLREKLSGAALRDRLVSEIATQVAQRPEPAFLKQLSDIGVVKVSGTDALPAQAVVFLAGSGAKRMIDEVQVPMIEKIKKGKVVVVGAETATIGESVVPTYQDAGAATVDNIDSPIGEVSLVFCLSGSPGHYGVKNSADALAPKLGAR